MYGLWWVFCNSPKTWKLYGSKSKLCAGCRALPIVSHPVGNEGPHGMGIVMQVDDAVCEFTRMLLILVATCGTLDSNLTILLSYDFRDYKE